MKTRREMFLCVSPIAEKEPKNFPSCPVTVYLSSGAMQALKPVVTVVKSTRFQDSILPIETRAEKHPSFNGVVIIQQSLVHLGIQTELRPAHFVTT